MKNYIVAFLLLMGSQLMGQSKISFIKGTWQEVLEKAKEEDKIIFIDVYADWCGPCKMMDRDVFTQGKVAEYYNANFVNAKFDADSEIGAEVANMFEVTALPTFLYIDPSGELVSKSLGYQEADEFLENGEKASVIGTEFVEYQKKFDAGERSIEFMESYLDLLNTKGDIDACRDILNDMIASGNTWKTEQILEVYVSIMEPSDFDDLFVYFLKNQEAFRAYIDGDRLDSAIAGYVLEKTYENATDMKDLAEQAEGLFEKHMPKSAEKFSSMVWITYYESEEDWDNYMVNVEKYLKVSEVDEYELNAFAWNIYINIDNPTYIERGIEMALQSVDIDPQFANVDTVAALYYKSGNKKKAKKYAKKALALGEEEGADTSDTEELLVKISAM